MSEKIYAYLLRLFPSTFRRRYEEDALRLLHDRLSDERGFFRRLRLSYDLITDIVVGLPQAYRNSYGEVAATASLTPQFDGIPSFRILQKEPIRREVIAIAGVFSVTAIATFLFVMSRPIPYRPAVQNGTMSSIESVIERLNRPISPNSADNGHADPPEPPSANLSRSEARPLTGKRAPLPSGTRSAVSAANQPAPSHEQNPNASSSNQGSSVAVAASSSLAQGQPGTMRNATPSAAPPNMQTFVHADVVANLPARWTRSFRAVGGGGDVPQWFILKQDSAKLTGTGGPDSTEQYPIIHGLVAGDSVKFELNNRRKTFLYDLRFEGKELRGTLSIKSANEMRDTKVRLERVQ